jgi:excisionase family DNA binding protein
MGDLTDLPPLLKAEEAAALLRTSRKAIYEMVRCRRLPGVTRIGRRVLIRRDDLLDWLIEQRDVPSPLPRKERRCR